MKDYEMKKILSASLPLIIFSKCLSPKLQIFYLSIFMKKKNGQIKVCRFDKNQAFFQINFVKSKYDIMVGSNQIKNFYL